MRKLYHSEEERRQAAREASRRYREKNRDKIRAKNREYRAANLERIRKKDRERTPRRKSASSREPRNLLERARALNFSPDPYLRPLHRHLVEESSLDASFRAHDNWLESIDLWRIAERECI